MTEPLRFYGAVPPPESKRPWKKRVGYVADDMIRELADALADVVVKAMPADEFENGDIMTYLSGTGAIHRAIKILAEYGVHVRPSGVDSRELVADRSSGAYTEIPEADVPPFNPPKHLEEA